MNRRSATWLAAAGAPVVVIGAALVVPMQASAAVDLPDLAPEQVLALVGDSDVTAFSGTIEQSSELGLPELPTGQGGSSGAGGSDASAALELLTGSHTARVFVDGPSRTRVQVLDQLAERDIVRNGADVWFYDSGEQEAVRTTLPAVDRSQLPTPADPAELAGRLVEKLDASSTLSVDADTRVAGRTAYDLVLTPDDEGTLVGSISVAVDSETGLPLRVRVTAAGQEAPAFETAFTSLQIGAQDPALFEFAPPAGTDVTERPAPALPQRVPDASASGGHSVPQPRVIGSGWSAVVEFPAGTVPTDALADPMLAQLTESVDGGRALGTSLVSVLVTDDGRVLAGSVPTSALVAAAG